MKGWELLRDVAEGKIKEGAGVKAYGLDTIWILDEYGDFVNKNNENDRLFEEYDTLDLGCRDFELLSEEIDIDSIEEYLENEIEYMCLDKVKPLAYKINELIKAVKQLNKKLEEK